MSKKILTGTEITTTMSEWAHDWEGLPADVAVGERLVLEMRPFVNILLESGFTPKTVRNHMCNLWIIGGEIIREVNDTPRRRRLSARKLILDAIGDGEAPLTSGLSESDQRSVDTTARRLLKFLTVV